MKVGIGLTILLCSLILSGCEKVNAPELPEPIVEPFFISGADLSLLPQIEAAGTVLFNADSLSEPMLTTLKEAGVNTVRLRLWKDPASPGHDFSSVKYFSQRLKSEGFKVWLTVHYSDTWADPGSQQMPQKWKSLPDMNSLLDSVYAYSSAIAKEMKPDYIQIGNEINNGFLHNFGNRYTNPGNFRQLLDTAASAIREFSPESKIILHYAGIFTAAEFYEVVKTVDYDIIGLSYYPMWHGKPVDTLSTIISSLNVTFQKPVVIAETSYPFTLGWNDYTNNIVGLANQLHEGYPATPDGQYQFLKKVFSEVRASNGGIGVCYWGGEWVSFRGPTATNGSSYENQAFYDFEFKALPVIKAFGE
ncbi:MAG: glycosyl hydrolase 53 family protein [Ignavibacteriales bacterium]|nr:glycosyl hydrolase 53 family protein [Ignavibacteriales bacterium]